MTGSDAPPPPSGGRVGGAWPAACPAAGLALAVLLGACAEPDPTAAPATAAGPEIVVSLSEPGPPPRDLLEQVGAGCWLDGILRGASMIVDRQTGRIIIVSDTENLLTADHLSPRNGHPRIRLAGPAVADPVKRDRLVETLETAAATGKTDCPIATG